MVNSPVPVGEACSVAMTLHSSDGEVLAISVHVGGTPCGVAVLAESSVTVTLWLGSLSLLSQEESKNEI